MFFALIFFGIVAVIVSLIVGFRTAVSGRWWWLLIGVGVISLIFGLEGSGSGGGPNQMVSVGAIAFVAIVVVGVVPALCFGAVIGQLRLMNDRREAGEPVGWREWIAIPALILTTIICVVALS